MARVFTSIMAMCCLSFAFASLPESTIRTSVFAGMAIGFGYAIGLRDGTELETKRRQ